MPDEILKDPSPAYSALRTDLKRGQTIVGIMALAILGAYRDGRIAGTECLEPHFSPEHIREHGRAALDIALGALERERGIVHQTVQ